MDIRQLHEQSGISVRRIRYVMDHDLVPLLSWTDATSVGRARQFEYPTAIVIVCACSLLEAGCKREFVRDFIHGMCIVMPAKRNQLGYSVIRNIIIGYGPGKVYCADGRYIRWEGGGAADQWFELGDKPKVAMNVTPRVLMELDVAQIRDQLSDI